jgi:hypothetical protein
METVAVIAPAKIAPRKAPNTVPTIDFAMMTPGSLSKGNKVSRGCSKATPTPSKQPGMCGRNKLDHRHDSSQLAARFQVPRNMPELTFDGHQL